MATTLSLPPIAVLAESAAALAQQAMGAAQVHALNKAALALHQGLEITPTAGGFLIPSGTRGGVVHRVSTLYGCSCEAGRKGQACWHSASIQIIEHAQMRAIPIVDRLAAYRKAKAEMDELFA